MRHTKNRKDPGSNPTRRSVVPWDPTSLRGFRWPSSRIHKQNNDWHWVSEIALLWVYLLPLLMVKYEQFENIFSMLPHLKLVGFKREVSHGVFYL